MQFKVPSYVSSWSPKMFNELEFSPNQKSLEIVRRIMAEVGGLPRTGKQNRQPVLTALVCSLHDCYVEGCPLGVSFTALHYRKSRRYTPSWYSYRNVRWASDALQTLGYVLKQPGYMNPETGEGKISKLYASGNLIDLFPVFEYQASMKEPLILRGNDKRNMEYRDIGYTKSKRNFIQDYNRFMLQHSATLDGRRLNTNICSIHSRGSFEVHGRLYILAGGHLSLAKDDRCRILINGEKTAEPDFTSLHLSLAYELSGLEVSADPYLDVCRHLGCSDALRGAVKLMVNTALNAKDKGTAIRAFHYENNKQRSAKNDSPKKQKAIALWEAMLREGVNSGEILKAIYEVHSEVSNWFCADAGIKLMFHDSEIMRMILERLMEMNIPALPVHDSVRVPESKAKIAEEVMNHAKILYLLAVA